MARAAAPTNTARIAATGPVLPAPEDEVEAAVADDEVALGFWLLTEAEIETRTDEADAPAVDWLAVELEAGASTVGDESAVGAAVDSVVGAAVDSVVGAAVDSVVGAAVDSVVGAAVDSVVGAAVDSVEPLPLQAAVTTEMAVST